MSDENEVRETIIMPGADSPEPVQEKFDLNFGLGEEVEDAEEPTEEVEENPVEETEAVIEEEEEVEDDTADDGDQEEEDGDTLEEEEVAAEAPEEVAPAQTKKPMVPKSRLDEVLSKQKALQKQLDDMKAAQVVAESAPEEYDFATKEVEYQTLVLDGEAEKAVQSIEEMLRTLMVDLEERCGEPLSVTEPFSSGLLSMRATC